MVAASSGDEGSGAFGGFVGPRTLLAIVQNAAPFLFGDSPLQMARAPEPHEGLLETAAQPLGYWALLRRCTLSAAARPSEHEWVEYFALCLAAHFASVDSFVPSDVDTKIRNHLWARDLSAEARATMKELVLALRHWDLRPVSARCIDIPGFGIHSGHDGERLSVLCGGIVGLTAAGDLKGAAQLEEAVQAELQREADAFLSVVRKPGRELDALKLAAVITHNAGDVDQGLGTAASPELRARLARLGHGGAERYGGAFALAARLYRELTASEGHRNYPLRELKALRRDPALLLPSSPFLDSWGGRLATYPWSLRERAEVVDGLIAATQKVRGQVGYYRALAGFDEAYPGGLDSKSLQQSLGTRARKALKDSALRQRLAVTRASFEASLAKRVRAIVASG